MRRSERISSLLEASPRKVFSVLAAYDRYAEWFPGVTRSRVLTREGDILVAEIVSPALREGKVVIECVHTPPEEIIFAQVDQYRSRGISGRLRVGEGEGGSASLEGRLEYTVSFFGTPFRRRVRSVLKEALGAAEKRAARRGLTAAGGGGEERAILEVRRREGELVVLFRGETFTWPLGAGRGGRT